MVSVRAMAVVITAVCAVAFAAPAGAATRHAGGVRTTAVPERAAQGARRPADASPADVCSVTMAPIAFGATPARGETIPVTVTVVCPAGLRYGLVLDQAGGCAATRALTGTGGTLAYRVLTPQGDPWCDGSAGTALVSGVGTGAAQTFVATAQIVDDVGRTRAGTFADTLGGRVQLGP